MNGCEALAGTEEKDTNLCKDETIEFKGVKDGKLDCNTEGDPKEVVLVLLDLHLAAEEEPIKKILEPLLLGKVLNKLLQNKPIDLECKLGVVEIKGTVACLMLPGLKEIPTTEMVEILCKVNINTHDPETGKCELLCESLEKEPLEANFTGKFEDTWENIHLLGFFNKDIFIDD